MCPFLPSVEQRNSLIQKEGLWRRVIKRPANHQKQKQGVERVANNIGFLKFQNVKQSISYPQHQAAILFKQNKPLDNGRNQTIPHYYCSQVQKFGEASAYKAINDKQNSKQHYIFRNNKSIVFAGWRMNHFPHQSVGGLYNNYQMPKSPSQRQQYHKVKFSYCSPPRKNQACLHEESPLKSSHKRNQTSHMPQSLGFNFEIKNPYHQALISTGSGQYNTFDGGFYPISPCKRNESLTGTGYSVWEQQSFGGKNHRVFGNALGQEFSFAQKNYSNINGNLSPTISPTRSQDQEMFKDDFLKESKHSYQHSDSQWHTSLQTSTLNQTNQTKFIKTHDQQHFKQFRTDLKYKPGHKRHTSCTPTLAERLKKVCDKRKKREIQNFNLQGSKIPMTTPFRQSDCSIISLKFKQKSLVGGGLIKLEGADCPFAFKSRKPLDTVSRNRNLQGTGQRFAVEQDDKHNRLGNHAYHSSNVQNCKRAYGHKRTRSNVEERMLVTKDSNNHALLTTQYRDFKEFSIRRPETVISEIAQQGINLQESQKYLKTQEQCSDYRLNSIEGQKVENNLEGYSSMRGMHRCKTIGILKLQSPNKSKSDIISQQGQQSLDKYSYPIKKVFQRRHNRKFTEIAFIGVEKDPQVPVLYEERMQSSYGTIQLSQKQKCSFPFLNPPNPKNSICYENSSLLTKNRSSSLFDNNDRCVVSMGSDLGKSEENFSQVLIDVSSPGSLLVPLNQQIIPLKRNSNTQSIAFHAKRINEQEIDRDCHFSEHNRINVYRRPSQAVSIFGALPEKSCEDYDVEGRDDRCVKFMERGSNQISEKADIAQFKTIRRINIPKEYQKGKFLGKGYFGQVFLGRHLPTGMLCGLKYLKLQRIKQQKMQESIRRQIQCQISLDHPYICKIYEFFYDECSNSLVLVVQFCEGQQLYSMMREKRRMSEEETAEIIHQLASAVEYMHRKHVIHRDLKPQNIMISEGVVKLCDFGWAIITTGSRKTICGTPLYSSPQIVLGKQYDRKVDLWGIGVLTYEMLLGMVPFKVYGEHQLKKIAQDQVQFPSYVDVSPKAQDFIQRILDKDPERRLDIYDILEHPFLQRRKRAMQRVSSSYPQFCKVLLDRNGIQQN